ncbi:MULTISPECIES: hypothetical protein [Pseudomonas]|uniref:hypothetical protein n=1 Tax=Pseudomonas TaxID=286 RepID=UPI0023D7ED74|nr:hypothetical protein [Pseudomonas sp. 273]
MHRLVLSLLLSLLVTLPGVARADDLDATLQAAQRYLLLYSATGDERFLKRLQRLDETFHAQVAEQRNGETLQDIWSLYGETVERVESGYEQSGPALREALAQALEVSALLQEFRVQLPPPGEASLAANLQRLALLKAKRANHKLLGADDGSLDEQVADLREAIGAQFTSLPDTPEGEAMRARWRYLQLTERPAGTLLYPFNAQVEYLLHKLEEGREG